MIALRKDVKVGFTIGGIALGVFGVYIGLSALAGEKPDNSMTGANLQLTPFGSAASPTSVADASKQTAPALAAKTAPIQAGVGPTLANPTQQVTVTDASGSDIWGNAFQTGKLQPAVTVTPDATRTGTRGGAAPKPSDVITAINTPADADPKPSSGNVTAEPESGTASAADPSGSLVDLTQSSLTRTPAGSASSASAASDSEASPAGTQSHTVEVGETFSSIAASYYGDSKYYKVIVDANPKIDPNKLKPGVVVKIPPLAKKEPKSDTVDVPSIATIDPSKQYIVKSGDSLSKIASALYGDQNMWQQIYDLNKSTIGDSPAKLKLGMVLNLPKPPTRPQ